MTAIETKHRRLNPFLFPLEEMVTETVDFIRANEPPEGYFVGFSGGKDSIVVLQLVKEAGVRHRAFYSSTGIDPPEIVKFIRQEYQEVTWLRPTMTFWQSLRRKSPPFRMVRWCCDKLKKEPGRPARLKSLFGVELRHRIMGIRAEESTRRASRPRIDSFNGQTLYKPIFRWAEWHVWEFIESRGLAYPLLYDEGFGRVGCVVCPFISPRKLQMHRDRWPAQYRIFERVVKDWFDNYRSEKARGKYPEQTAEEYLEAYYAGKLIAPTRCEAPGLFGDWS